MTPEGVIYSNMTDYGRKIGRVLWPLVLHTVISALVAFGVGWLKDALALLSGRPATEVMLSGADSTLVTVVTALVSLPVFWKMWNRSFSDASETAHTHRWFYVAAFLGGIAASCLSSVIMDVIGIENYFSNQVQEELLSAGFLLQIVGLGVIVPLLEELLYRGVVYQRLREFLDVKPAIVTAALIFALAHGNMIQFLYALPMALILHWLQEKSGSLQASVLFHMGANLISVVVNAFFVS